MAHIEKVTRIDGTKVYYQGNLKWTENFSDRKVSTPTQISKRNFISQVGTVVTE